ncbi:hypothetical protein, partial [Staphylococcus aureus]
GAYIRPGIQCPPDAGPDAHPAVAAMDGNSAGEYHTIRIPAGTMVDGAVVELQAPADSTIITAVLRIPGPPAP